MPEQAGMKIWIPIHLKTSELFDIVFITFQADSSNKEENKAIALLVTEPV